MLTRFRSYQDLAAALLRAAESGEVKTISFDVFDTLIHRRLAPSLVLEGVCHVLRDLLAEHGITVAHEPLMHHRHEAYMSLVARHVAAGLDPDTTLDELATEWVARAAAIDADDGRAVKLGRRLVDAEVAIERRVCFANPWLKDVLPELKRRGIAVLCISDMYLGQRYVSAILGDCGFLPSIDSVHVSGDVRLLKRTGRLFDHLEETAGLRREAWLHVGDNFHADGIMANQNGTRAWIINDPLIHDEARRQEFDAETYRTDQTWAGMIAAGYAQAMPEPSISEEEAFGRRILGPIFAGFIHRVLERCKEEGIGRVFFLAREGHLLKKLYLQLACLVFPSGDYPAAVYLAISRLTALLAAMHGYGIREFSAAMANTAHFSVRNLLAPLRLEESVLLSLAARNGLPDVDAALPAPILEFPPLLRLLDDPELQRHTAAIEQSARTLLHAYLVQEGWMEHERIAVVDLGWGGQIQDSLYSSLRSTPERPIIFGFYLGTNAQAAWRDCVESRLEGLLADYRQPHWASCSALEFVYAFEAAARAPHGTTLGYKTDSDGRIVPFFKEADSSSRQAEIADEGFVALAQSGIVAYAGLYAECAAILRLHAGDTLPYARTMIERMVRYPTRQEISWWMRLSNVADLGSASTDRLGGDAARPSWLALRSRLRSSPFHYGLVGSVAGRPGQIALAAVKGLGWWRRYRPVAPIDAASTSFTSPKLGADPVIPSWELAIDEDFARILKAAPGTPIRNANHRITALTLRELLPMRIGYALARLLALFRGVELPGQDAPGWLRMTRRHLHARHNLRARLTLLGKLMGRSLKTGRR